MFKLPPAYYQCSVTQRALYTAPTPIVPERAPFQAFASPAMPSSLLKPCHCHLLPIFVPIASTLSSSLRTAVPCAPIVPFASIIALIACYASSISLSNQPSTEVLCESHFAEHLSAEPEKEPDTISNEYCLFSPLPACALVLLYSEIALDLVTEPFATFSTISQCPCKPFCHSCILRCSYCALYCSHCTFYV